MGITKNFSHTLVYAKTLGVSYSVTLMLGRQVLYATTEQIESQLSKFKVDHAPLPANLEGKFSEPLFHALGAEIVDSMDYSTFEQATVIHDLNQPVPEKLKDKYSVVIDGGTLEHVFNFPVAVKNCMDMIRVGGHYISISPANNQCGHGFYQFSPELFFSLFQSRHGFEIKMVAIGLDYPDGQQHWYEVQDPRRAKKRVTLSNDCATHLLVIAQKLTDTAHVELRPMQSDYEMVWQTYESLQHHSHVEGEPAWMRYYRRFTPAFLKKIARALFKNSHGSEIYVSGLGQVDPDLFKRVDI